MSGQPVQTDADAVRFRTEYLETLNLQAQNDDMNYQANKVYLQTGQLPPQAQLPDTRSTAEKLKDLEFLKKSIIEDLRPIAEPTFALEIYNRVEQHALNVEGSFLRWLAQNGAEIAKQLSKKYKFGIAGDLNDAEIIVQFMASAYSNIRHSSQSVKSYMSSTSGIGQQRSSAILSVNDIDAIITVLQDFKKRIAIFAKKSPQNFAILDNINLNLTQLKKSLPTTEELKQIIERIDNENLGQGQNFLLSRESRQLELVFDILKSLPKLEVINTLLYNAERAIDRQDENLFLDNINRIRNLFGFIFEQQNIDALYNFMREFKIPAEQQLRYEKAIETKQLRSEIEQQNEDERNRSKAEKVYVINPITDPMPVHDIAAFNFNANPARPEFIRPDMRPLRNIDELETLYQYSNLSDQQINNYFGVFQQAIVGIDALYHTNYQINPGFAALQNNPPAIRALIQDIFQNVIPQPGQPGSLSQAVNFNIQGHGIGQRKGRPRGGSLNIKPKEPAFIGFGINEIDRKKLDNNILSIRRDTRSKIKGFTNRHISEPMKRIIKNFIGGSVPNYNDMSSLDNEEREYLNKIVEHSNLNDRLSVPAPSKDQREKDFHSFEVMKGEILAGNDSKDLIKKFKLLMIKLSRQNLLPKSEVQELMEELTELGY